MRWPGLAAGFVLLCAPGPSLAQDGDLPEAQATAIQEVVGLVQELGIAEVLSGEHVKRAADLLKDLPTDRLPRALSGKRYDELSPLQRDRLRQALTGVRYLRAFGDGLSRPEDIAARLSSSEAGEVAEGLSTLLSGQYGDGFQRAVVALSRDPRPDLRLAAGILAKYGTLFAGGTESYRKVALKLLEDEDPLVAARFGGHHAMDFLDPKIIDRLVERFDDKRKIPDNWASTFFSDTVSGAMVYGFRDYVSEWRAPKRAARGALPEPLPAGSDPKVLAKWWSENGRLLPKISEYPRWQLVFDGTVDLERGKLTDLRGATRSIQVRMNRFTVQPNKWDHGSLHPSISVDLEVLDEPLYGEMGWHIGNPDMFFGWIAGAATQDYRGRLLVAPLEEKGARARLWLWFKPE